MDLIIQSIFGGYVFNFFFNFFIAGLHTIHGPGKTFPRVENPTQELIDQYHEWYVSAIIDLFDRNKWRFGMDNVQLKVV